MNQKRQIKAILLTTLGIFLLHLSLPKTVHASCIYSFVYKPNLVVAKVVNRELRCDLKGNVVSFEKQLTIKGSVEKSFKIITSTQECPYEESTEENSGKIRIRPYSDWAGIEPLPEFETNKKYLLSISPYKTKEKVLNQYFVPSCDRIAKEISGTFSPIVLFNIFKVWLWPIWRVTLLFIYAVDLLLMSLFPSLEALALGTFIFSTIIVIFMYCLVIYLIYRAIKYFLKKRKQKNKKE